MKKRGIKKFNQFVLILLAIVVAIPTVVYAANNTLRNKLNENNNFHELGDITEWDEEAPSDDTPGLKAVSLDLTNHTGDFTGNIEFTGVGDSFYIIYNDALKNYTDEDGNKHVLSLRLDFEVTQYNEGTLTNTGKLSDRYYNGINLNDDGTVQVSSYYRESEKASSIPEQWTDGRTTNYTVTHTFYDENGNEYDVSGLLIGIEDPDNANYIFQNPSDITSRNIYFKDAYGQETWNKKSATNYYPQIASESFLVKDGGLFRDVEGTVKNIDGVNRLGGFQEPGLYVALNDESSYTFTVQGWRDRVSYPFLYEYIKYTVTYHDNVENEVIFEDQVHTPLYYGDNTPAYDGDPDIRTGYTFKGWAATPDGEVLDKLPTVTGDADYYAVWERVPYTVTYHDNVDKEVVFDDQPHTPVYYGDDTPAYDGDPDIRNGYVFKGWAATPDGEVLDKLPAVTGNADYYAIWEAIPYTVIYNDGVEDEVVFEDDVHPELIYNTPTPGFRGSKVRPGYTFTGWSPAVLDRVTGNMIYYAQWKKNPPYIPPVTGIR